ncbi:hypothetical protein N836_04595 [Leptolyngbya sp. Heron Island J]|uniref:hypothetical protein n=1 Tax=Leptolyngbya sp. Heron Island J TaxID=1385935 RepID=UPI0003B94DBB|nr:hypothetical protein [Leptolyngbya sp. Heron Island J]ESA37093.1 hypothetical protein N836_04595 [Leptolyngbya sp. Heron Island J]
MEINLNSEAALMLISTQEYQANQRQIPIWLVRQQHPHAAQRSPSHTDQQSH